MLSMCILLLQRLNIATDFHEIRYECYAIIHHPKAVPSKFPKSVITTWLMHEYVAHE
jgi:hypothetical protein